MVSHRFSLDFPNLLPSETGAPRPYTLWCPCHWHCLWRLVQHLIWSMTRGYLPKMDVRGKVKTFLGVDLFLWNQRRLCHVFELGTCCRHRWVWRRHFTGRAQRMKVQEWASWRFFSEGAGLGLLLYISIPTLTTITFYFRCGKICNGCQSSFSWFRLSVSEHGQRWQQFHKQNLKEATWYRAFSHHLFWQEPQPSGRTVEQNIAKPFKIIGP